MRITPSLVTVLSMYPYLFNRRNALPQLSLRQLLRICNRLSYNQNLHHMVINALLYPFLPLATREVIDGMLETVKLYPMKNNTGNLEISTDGGVLTIGTVSHNIHTPMIPSLIPKLDFIPVPQHISLLQDMLVDYKSHDHILLIGNQGVGKNVLSDKLLELIRHERQYIQLHRDTTIQSLTLLPAIKDGVMCWEDSPLVIAAREGYVLVVDEADKAPLEVTVVLKGLAEDGEMLLSDGRRIVLVYTFTDFRSN